MSWNYKKIFDEFARGANYKLLLDSRHGLERECHRITSDGQLSQVAHPEDLGAALTSSLISTDFAESQLEMITPPEDDEFKAISYMEDLHTYVARTLKNNKEHLWPFSMPCRLPENDKDIPLAQYGKSKLGENKTTYRRALGYRYGRRMQTVSGIHYNISFGERFWKVMYKKFAHKGENEKDFISRVYFKIMRNYLNLSWMDNYLFGASPVIDKSYLKTKPLTLKKLDKDTYFGKYSTTLRMSSYGYCCKVQSTLQISFNSLEEYVKGITDAITAKSSKYAKIGLKKDGERIQLNYNKLQTPSEYYAAIRAKRRTAVNEDILNILYEQGVEYLEVRSADISPFDPSGVSREHLMFLHLLVLYCLFEESPDISGREQLQMIKNHNEVAINGRKPNLKLVDRGKKLYLREWGTEVLKKILPIAKMLDKNFSDNRYTELLKKQFEKFENSELTPSAKILQALQKEKKTFLNFGLELSKKHFQYFMKNNLSKAREKLFDETVVNSHLKQEEIEVFEQQFLKGFEDMEVSTQVLMKEAMARKIKVEVLDRKANFIRLSKGKKVEYVHQATKTSKDSLITNDIMENKKVTKIILDENGISVPQGDEFNDINKALGSYDSFSHLNLVIKPTTTNYGIGLNFAKAGDGLAYEKGLRDAFKHGSSVIVEEFIEGKEYRFLVLGNKTEAVTLRIPANIIGDGKSTIKELISQKNYRPKNHKFPKYFIRMGKEEREKLKSMGLTFTSIPKKGKQIFLRDNSNVSTGGDPIDMTDDMSEPYKEIAVRAAKTVNATFCGVDMIVKDFKKPPTKNNHSIIELNFNPILSIHNFPYEGKNRDVGKPTLDLLGF
jgi:glutamate--cysteine ligase